MITKYVLQQCIGREEITDEIKWIDKITYTPEYYTESRLKKMMQEDLIKFKSSDKHHEYRIIERHIIESVVM